MSEVQNQLYERFAQILTYPDDTYSRRVSDCGELVNRTHPAFEQTFERFSGSVTGRPVTELEELFTRTFDLNPACCLEVGWHLFGENYERGRFLVRMRQELRRRGLEESTEMPDHLAHVLQALARMEPDLAAGFISDGVLPALNKMTEALKGKDNPFEGLLQSIQGILETTVPDSEEVADA